MTSPYADQPGPLVGARDRLRLALTIGWTEPVELFSGIGTLLWGLILTIPFQPGTFATSSGFRVLYRLLAAVGLENGTIAEAVVGSVALAIGSTSIASMLFGMRRLRIVMAYTCFVWWVFLLVAVGLSNPTLPGLALYVTQAAMRLWTALRLFGVIQRPKLGLWSAIDGTD